MAKIYTIKYKGYELKIYNNHSHATSMGVPYWWCFSGEDKNVRHVQESFIDWLHHLDKHAFYAGLEPDEYFKALFDEDWR